MKFKEIGIALLFAMTIVMAMNVTRVRAITGDLNGDGVVDILDVAIAAGLFGTNNPVGDVNGDGLVDVFDLVIIATNFT